MRRIAPEPLTKAAFSTFGEVVELADAAPIVINQGFASRVDSLAHVDVAREGGELNIGLFVSETRPAPIDIVLMERHPLGSQLFFPLQDRGWLVLVCTDPRDLSSFKAFAAGGRQGVNYARNVWHHPLLVKHDGDRFLVLDRKGSGRNLEELRLNAGLRLHIV